MWDDKRKGGRDGTNWILDLPEFQANNNTINNINNSDLDIIHGQSSTFFQKNDNFYDGGKKIRMMTQQIPSSTIRSWTNEFTTSKGHGHGHGQGQGQGLDSDSDSESPFASLFLPCFKYLHFINICPDSFYCAGAGSLGLKSGSIFRKILSFIVEIGVLLHIYGSSKLHETVMTENMKIMFKIVTLAYAAFQIAVYYSLLTKCGAIQQLLMNLREIEEDILSVGCKIPKTLNYKIFAWVMTILYFALMILFTSVMRLSITTWVDKGFDACLQTIASTVITELNLMFPPLNLTFDPNVMPIYVNAAVVIPYIFLSIVYDSSWVFGFLMNFMWGICFTRLFKTFYAAIDKRDGAGRRTLEDLRKFNAITFVIDEFNAIFSLVVFTAVVSGSLHFSVYIVTAPTPDPKGLVPIMTIGSFAIFWLQLFSAAAVSSAAHVMAKKLKERFRSVELWSKNNGRCNETTQGILIAFHELSSGNIGFQGLGFFTVTYSFIGSVVSLIATYSIVAIQMGSTK